jgi:hypothetical protein
VNGPHMNRSQALGEAKFMSTDSQHVQERSCSTGARSWVALPGRREFTVRHRGPDA